MTKIHINFFTKCNAPNTVINLPIFFGEAQHTKPAFCEADSQVRKTWVKHVTDVSLIFPFFTRNANADIIVFYLHSPCAIVAFLDIGVVFSLTI